MAVSLQGSHHLPGRFAAHDDMKAQRQQQITLYLSEHETASMEELCTHFNVSMNTVRRDVAELVRNGQLEKVYGGVRSKRKVTGFEPYEERSLKPSPAKQAICREAARLVHDGDIIFIDSGTTTVHLMEALKEKSITVITNNIEVMTQALHMPSIQLIVLPGELHRSTHSITGEDSAEFLSRFNTNLAFMAATGISQNGGVTNSIPLEYQIKKAAVSHTEKAVLMVTGNKFGITSLLTYAQLGSFHSVITDRRISPEWIERLGAFNVHYEIASNY